MNKLIEAIAEKIDEGDPTWKADLIRDFDCIKNMKDLRLLDMLLMPINAGTQIGGNLIEPSVGGVPMGYTIAAYGAGTPYALTNAQAAINLGTTDPAIVIDQPGKYLVFGQFHVAYNGATVVAETATLKVRRTNNTPADVSVLPVIDLPASVTLTHTHGLVQIPPFVYQTENSDDGLSLFGALSAALGAGTIDITAIGTSLVAVRLSDDVAP